MVEHTAESTILCGVNSYIQRFYLSPAFQELPESIKRELQILCVSITEEAGGMLTLELNEAGNLLSRAGTEDGDYLFGDVASSMKISKACFGHQKLLEELEPHYRIVFLGERI